MCEITTVRLFRRFDSLRRSVRLTIEDVAQPLLGISPRTYIKWRKGTVPDAIREPKLRDAIQFVHTGIETGQFKQ